MKGTSSEAIVEQQIAAEEREADSLDELMALHSKNLAWCLHCGGRAVIEQNDRTECFFAECGKCGARSQDCGAIEMAVTRWNSFLPPQHIRDLLFRFAKALTFIDTLGGWENNEGVFEMKPQGDTSQPRIFTDSPVRITDNLT